MSAHRKPGPAVLDGGRRYEPKHRDSASDRQHEWALPMRLMDDFCEMRWHLKDEQQREADRAAGEEMRLRSERFNRVIQGFSQSARDFQAPTTGGAA